MPAKTVTETVTLDRDLVERFIVEVDALGLFDTIRNGGQETSYPEHIYAILEPFETAALGRLSDERTQELHDRAHERARELARQWFGHLFAEEGESDA